MFQGFRESPNLYRRRGASDASNFQSRCHRHGMHVVGGSYIVGIAILG